MTEQQLNYDQTGRMEANETDVVFSQGLLAPTSPGPKLTLTQIQRLVDHVQKASKNTLPVTVSANTYCPNFSRHTRKPAKTPCEVGALAASVWHESKRHLSIGPSSRLGGGLAAGSSSVARPPWS